MNHFFALPVPDFVKSYIADRVVRWWRPAMGEDFEAQWYAEGDYHITLKFLGDVPAQEQNRLIAAAEAVAAQTEPFTLSLAKPGVFPKNTSRSPRVFWMGVAATEELILLAARMDHVMHEHGFPREARVYTPHITLARRKRLDSGRSDSGVERNERSFPLWNVDHFALMQTTSPKQRRNEPKARYTTVHAFPFGTPHSFTP